MEADENVVEHGASGEYTRLLKRAHNAERGNTTRFEAIEARAAIDDVSGGDWQITSDGVEGRSLARAVRTNQREHLPFVDVEGHALDSGHAAKTNRQLLDRKGRCRNCAHCAACPPLASAASTAVRLRSFHQLVIAGTMPFGRIETITIIKTP